MHACMEKSLYMPFPDYRYRRFQPHADKCCGNDLHSSTISTKDGVAFRGMYIEWTCWSKIRAPGRQWQLVPTLQVCVNFIPPKLLGQNSKAPTVVCSTITYDRTSSIDQTMRLKETYNKSTAIGYCVWIEFIFDV